MQLNKVRWNRNLNEQQFIKKMDKLAKEGVYIVSMVPLDMVKKYKLRTNVKVRPLSDIWERMRDPGVIDSRAETLHLSLDVGEQILVRIN